MRKFYFMHPLSAGENSSNHAVTNTDNIRLGGNSARSESDSGYQSAPIDYVSDENADYRGNDYATGNIDLDKALEEYYKSLLNDKLN